MAISVHGASLNCAMTLNFTSAWGLKFKWQMQEGFCIGNCAKWRETFKKLEDVLIYIKSRYNYPISQS